MKRFSIITFYDDSFRILLQDRRDIAKDDIEWGFFGGHIEQGETVEQALIREVKEELEYDLQEFRYVATVQMNSNDIECEGNLFVAKLPPLEEFTQHEGQGMQLFTLNEARKLHVYNIDKKHFDNLEKFFLNL